MTPLGIDLFCGLGGWTEGLLAEGYRVVGFDIERHHYGDAKYPAQLVLQDVLTLHGSQFRDAALIVASPPCQEFSYMAMPWSKAKEKRAAILADPAERKRLTALFDACFRIQREAIEAAGHFIPLVVENVRGANEWVGRSRWNYGSFHLWGDVPALMPMTKSISSRVVPEKVVSDPSIKVPGLADGHFPPGGLAQGYIDGHKVPGFRFDGSGKSFQSASVEGTKNTGGSWFGIDPRGNPIQPNNGRDGHIKHGGDCFNDPSWPGKQGGQKTTGPANIRDGHSHTRHLTNQAEHDGVKQGGDWFNASQPSISRMCGSKSPARKAASAAIAKIPFALARYIARVWKPRAEAVA